MTQSYGHLNCENFKAPLKEFSPIPPEEYRSDKYTWRRFPHFDEMSKDLAKINVHYYYRCFSFVFQSHTIKDYYITLLFINYLEFGIIGY